MYIRYIIHINSRKLTMTTLTPLPLISKLSHRIIRILGCNPGPMTLQGTNTYLVGTGHRRMLIDSGDVETGVAYIKVLNKVLRNENATIEHLVITHWHHDHIGGVNYVQDLLKNLDPEGNIAKVWKLPSADSDEETSEKFNYQDLNDEQILEVEGANVKIKHTPGHTMDHACLFLEDERILFSGDCILGEGTAVFENLYDYMNSLQKILQLAPTVIYPGHGPVLEEPLKHIQYYIEHRQQRESEILKVLAKNGTTNPMSEMDIVQIIYKETPEHLWSAAVSNVHLHLQKLLKEKKVGGQNGEWYLVQPQ